MLDRLTYLLQLHIVSFLYNSGEEGGNQRFDDSLHLDMYSLSLTAQPQVVRLDSEKGFDSKSPSELHNLDPTDSTMLQWLPILEKI